MNKFTLLKKICFLLFIFSSKQLVAQTDACTGATALTIGATCVTTAYSIPQTFTNDAADPALCTGTSYRDGWYTFTTDATTTSVIITGTSNRQLGLAVYSGTCGSLTQVACNVPANANATVTATVTPSTTYYLRIIRTNNAGANAMTGDICVSKPCASVTTLPYTQGFDAAAFPSCWTTSLVNGTANWTIGATSVGGDISAPQSGTRFISKQYTTSTADLISPPFNLAALGANQARLSVWLYRHASTVAADKIDVYVNNSSSATGATSLLSISVLTTGTPAVTTAGWYKYSADIPTSFNTAGQIYFIIEGKTTAGLSSYDLGVDNFVVEQIPTCESPINITKSSITTVGATLNWDPPATGSPVSYDVYYNTSNTAPTSLTTPSVAGVTATTTSIGPLVGSTKYYYWLRSNCGTTNGYSTWTNIDSLTTACVAAPAPFTELFSSGLIPSSCWTNTSSNTVANGLWKFTGTPDYGALTNGRPSGSFAWVDGSDPSTISDVTLSTPFINTTGLTQPQLTFDYFSNNTQSATYPNNTLKVDINDGSGWVNIFTDNTNDPNWRTIKIPLTAYINATVQVRFVVDKTAAPVGYAFYDDILLDNVNLIQTPTCDVPVSIVKSAITATSATLTWSPPVSSTPASYDVYYSASSVAPTTPTTAGITATTTNLTPLVANTKYYYWLRSNCGTTNGYSAWTNIDSFTTACNSTVVPYSLNFNGITNGTVPSCTSIENAGTGNNWAVAANPAAYGFSSKVLRYAYNSTNAANAWFYTQGLNLTGGTFYRLTYKYGNDDTFYTESMNVSYGTSASSVDMVNLLADHPTINAANAATNTVDFMPATTGTYYIGFHAYSIADQEYLYLDDVTVTLTPTCDVPTGLTASNVTATSADISWQAPVLTTPTSYQLYYSTTNAAPTASTVVSVPNITGLFTTLGTLAGGTTYYVWVRSVCNVGDTSAWTPVSFVFATIPANDECINAVSLTKGVGVTSTTAGATQSLPPATCSASTSTTSMDVWYTFTPAYDGTVTATLSGVNTAVDIVLEAFTGDCSNLTSAGCVDVNGAGGNETITSNTVVAGTTYYLRVYAYTTATVTAQGAFTITITGSALPIHLVNFTGERNGATNILHWTTANEVNNASFELQRSADGITFSKIAIIASKAENGNSNTNLNYLFVDEKPLTANNYYRLKQIDKDGKSAISEVVLIKGTKATKLELVNVYPNPAKEKLNVVIASPKADRVTIIVTDIAGKVMMQQVMQVVNNDNNLSINVQSLSKGNYFIKVLCADGCETAVKKFIKD